MYIKHTIKTPNTRNTIKKKMIFKILRFPNKNNYPEIIGSTANLPKS